MISNSMIGLFAICTIFLQESLVSNKLIIHSPKKLADMFEYTSEGTTQYGVIPASYANFGFVPYGHSMVS